MKPQNRFWSVSLCQPTAMSGRADNLIWQQNAMCGKCSASPENSGEASTLPTPSLSSCQRQGKKHHHKPCGRIHQKYLNGWHNLALKDQKPRTTWAIWCKILRTQSRSWTRGSLTGLTLRLEASSRLIATKETCKQLFATVQSTNSKRTHHNHSLVIFLTTLKSVN